MGMSAQPARQSRGRPAPRSPCSELRKDTTKPEQGPVLRPQSRRDSHKEAQILTGKKRRAWRGQGKGMSCSRPHGDRGR